MGISGCGPTCLSMVLYSLTGDKNLTPDMLAQRAMEDGYYVEGVGTSWLFMGDIAREYGITVNQFPSADLRQMEETVDNGGLIICAVGPGDFTDEGHFIVIRGILTECLQLTILSAKPTAERNGITIRWRLRYFRYGLMRRNRNRLCSVRKTMNLVRALPGYLMESGNGNQYSPEEFDKIEDSVLSETEKYNLDQIKAVEKQKS